MPQAVIARLDRAIQYSREGLIREVAAYWVPRFRGVRLSELPLPSHRAAPVLQRRPHAARQPKLVDRGRAAERLEAVQLDAAPLEAAFLQNVARGGVGHSRAGKQMLAGKLLEEIVDRRARSLGAKA